MEDSLCQVDVVDDTRVIVTGAVYAEKDLFGNICALYKKKDNKNIECVRIGCDNIVNISLVDNDTYLVETE